MSTGQQRPVFDPKPTGSATWKLKLARLLRIPSRRFLPAAVTAVGIYLVAYNGIVWYVYGDQHPLNRFQWRMREAEGSIDPELLQKKKIVFDYYLSRIKTPNEEPPQTHF